jgi:two-component system, cell cycle response regulator DivK
MMNRILYVEDDPVNAMVIQKFLEKTYRIFHLEDGESCLEYLQENTVDLILMDINLGRGKMDGVETLQHIRKSEMGSRLPVIALTAYAMPEDERRFLLAGFNGYLSKPVERENLLNSIHKFLPL